MEGHGGDVGAYIRAQIAKVNLVALDKIWDNGFRQITTSTKPINTPEDLRGFKIRVPVSPMWTSMFKAFDSAPASINASEMYTALQTKVVDGQENPLAVISNFIYEVQKYCSIITTWDGFWTWSTAAPGTACRRTCATSRPSTSMPRPSTSAPTWPA